MKEALLLVSGRVQGVFFRANAKEEAERLELKGYAKNLDNGSVEILVQGKEDRIGQFIKWCEEGPKSATVTNIKIAWQEPGDFYNKFSTL